MTEFQAIFVQVWGPGILTLLAFTLAGGIAMALYHIIK